MGSLYRTHACIQARQALCGADIAPLAAMHVPTHQARGDGALQKRQQWKPLRGAAAEELRPVHADPGVGEAVALAADHAPPLEPEVPARMMRRVEIGRASCRERGGT